MPENGITRDEKIELIERERDSWQCDADDHKKRGCMAHYEHEQAMADVLTEAMGALHGPQPDPDTGLCRCGCGGKATIHHSTVSRDDECYAGCSACDTQGPCALGDESATIGWNTAMGWRESE